MNIPLITESTRPTFCPNRQASTDCPAHYVWNLIPHLAAETQISLKIQFLRIVTTDMIHNFNELRQQFTSSPAPWKPIPTRQQTTLISSPPPDHRPTQIGTSQLTWPFRLISFQNHHTASSLAQGGSSAALRPYMISGRTGQNCLAACGMVSPSVASSWVSTSTFSVGLAWQATDQSPQLDTDLTQ